MQRSRGGGALRTHRAAVRRFTARDEGGASAECPTAPCVRTPYGQRECGSPAALFFLEDIISVGRDRPNRSASPSSVVRPRARGAGVSRRRRRERARRSTAFIHLLGAMRPACALRPAKCAHTARPSSAHSCSTAVSAVAPAKASGAHRARLPLRRRHRAHGVASAGATGTQVRVGCVLGASAARSRSARVARLACALPDACRRPKRPARCAVHGGYGVPKLRDCREQESGGR
jgi:hypothetical protein